MFYKEKFSMLRVFDGISVFQEGYIDIIPVNIYFKGKMTGFGKMQFNVIDGRVSNVYFKDDDGDLLKFGDLFSFFVATKQIDDLAKVLEVVAENAKNKKQVSEVEQECLFNQL